MNKWERAIANFFKPHSDITMSFILENEKYLLYRWKPDNMKLEYRSLLVKGTKKVYVWEIGANFKRVFVRPLHYWYKGIGKYRSWKGVWTEVCSLNFNPLEENTQEIYDSIKMSILLGD